MFDQIVFVMEILGVIAFALSGGVIAIEKRLDYFGIVTLSVVSSVGGGVIRDLILGITPPNAFVNPIYTIIAIITSFCLILSMRFMKRRNISHKVLLEKFTFINYIDALGLGIFTIVGIDVCYQQGFDYWFLLCFTGMITGVGGGILRDVLIRRKPVVLVKDVYAVASLAGGILYTALRMSFLNNYMSMVIGVLFIFIIRCIAMQKSIHLPRVE